MKIIASDYDGTVNCGGVSDADKEAITRFRKAGNKFGIVTGRDLEMALWVLYDMKTEIDFLICCTGAIILDGKGNILYEKRQKLDSERVLEMISEGRKRHYGNFNFSDKLVRIYADRNGNIPVQIDKLEEFTQLNFWFPNESECIDFVDYLDKNHGDYVKAYRNGGSLDIPPLGISKPTGVLEYAKMLDGVEKIYAVGDNLNDIPMIEAFEGFAVSNAKDEVKAVAKHQCNRIADMIDYILEEEK